MPAKAGTKGGPALRLRPWAPASAGATEKEELGIICVIHITLMSAVSSSRRVNSWLSFKRLFEAVPGTAGGAAVVATVDHTLMRGSVGAATRD